MNGNGCLPMKRGAFPLTNGLFVKWSTCLIVRPVVNFIGRAVAIMNGRWEAHHECSSGMGGFVGLPVVYRGLFVYDGRGRGGVCCSRTGDGDLHPENPGK
jgi:hypothetical protein